MVFLASLWHNSLMCWGLCCENILFWQLAISGLGSLVCSEIEKAQGTAASSSWKNARNLRRLRKRNGKVISSIASEESVLMRRGRLPASLLWNSTTLTTEHLHLCHSLISNHIPDSFSESMDSILISPKGRYCRQTGLDLVILSLSSAAHLKKMDDLG